MKVKSKKIIADKKFFLARRRCDVWLGKRDSSGVRVAQSGRKRLMVSVMDRRASLHLPYIDDQH